MTLCGERLPSCSIIPILGPMIGVVALLAGCRALWAAGLFLIHRRRRDGDADAARPALHDQPGAGHLPLVFWYWMWGVPGAVLSTGIAITKTQTGSAH